MPFWSIFFHQLLSLITVFSIQYLELIQYLDNSLS